MPPPELQFRTIDIAGIEWTYWVPDDQPRAPAPLLIAFHGLGMTGRKLALWTGLAERGPAAGFATAFPDALGRVWDDHGTVRRDGGNDIAFVDTLITRLQNMGATGDRPVFLVGLSNGAAFAERVTRTAAVDVSGMALVAGTAREASRARTPEPPRPAALLAMLGTSDRSFPFEGGRSRSRLRRQASLRTRLALSDTSGHEVVAAQTLIDDWAQANGVTGEPAVDRLDAAAGDPPVTRLTWAGLPPIVLYRVEGGGHGWPGASQVLAARMFGRIPRRFDATGTILEFARRAYKLDDPVGETPLQAPARTAPGSSDHKSSNPR
jgi:polyhydroxybutyrate depolymerase